MPSKRTADDPGGSRRLKQTKLSFGHKPSRKEHQEEKTQADGRGGETREQSADGDDKHQSEGQQTNGGSAPGTAVLEHPPMTGLQQQQELQRSQEKKGSSLVRVTEKTGNLFGAPPNSVLIHACNCAGHWGAGIAAAFRKRYPSAYKAHVAFCEGQTPEQLVGTAQLIPPCELDDSPRHYIGCLFTSRRYGRAKDSPCQIIRATGPAMRDLLEQIEVVKESGQSVAEIRMCRINSGLFAVPWEDTKEAIEGLNLEAGADIVAWDRDE